MERHHLAKKVLTYSFGGSSYPKYQLVTSHSITKLPIVIKGVLRPDDAEFAVQHGASAIAVSNHGGRQLDGVQATVLQNQI